MKSIIPDRAFWRYYGELLEKFKFLNQNFVLLFHCLVVLRNPGWIRGLYFGCKGMEGGCFVGGGCFRFYGRILMSFKRSVSSSGALV